MPDTDQPNKDQAALWNDASGRTWVELQDVLDRVLAPFADLLVEEAFPGEGGHVLDIGCGAGATTLAMARRVGRGGHGLGVDISGPLIAAAKAGAAAENVGCADFVQADAQTHIFDPESFDAIISRFGVMFFDDPQAAFANMKSACRKGGKLTFIAWRGPAENPFMTAAARAAAPFLPALPIPSPDQPGQFAFADGEHVRRILIGSGWSDVDLRPIDIGCTMSEEDLLTYITRMGPVGLTLRQADAPTRARVVEVLRAAFNPFVRDGAAHFNGACWLATARA